MDEDLLGRALEGDESAFTALYRSRQGPIYRFALHMTGSEAIADDVTQEVFIALLSATARYDRKPRVGHSASVRYRAPLGSSGSRTA